MVDVCKFIGGWFTFCLTFSDWFSAVLFTCQKSGFWKNLGMSGFPCGQFLSLIGMKLMQKTRPFSLTIANFMASSVEQKAMIGGWFAGSLKYKCYILMKRIDWRAKTKSQEDLKSRNDRKSRNQKIILNLKSRDDEKPLLGLIVDHNRWGKRKASLY